MERHTEIEAIKNFSNHYIQVENKSLENRLSEINVENKKQIESIKESSKDVLKEVGKSLVNSVPGISLVSKAAFVFMDWNKKVDDDLEDVKKVMLIESYLNKTDNHEKAIENLREAMTDLHGNTLVNKIFRMLSDYPPDGDWFKHLQTALRNICDSKKFEKLFDIHKFNLGLIEKMSPQALSILADAKNWPKFHFEYIGMSVGGKITDQFQRPFSKVYANNKKNIADPLVIERIVHIINDLQNNGFIECYGQQGSQFKLELTGMGNSLYEYLSD